MCGEDLRQQRLMQPQTTKVMATAGPLPLIFDHIEKPADDKSYRGGQVQTFSYNSMLTLHFSKSYFCFRCIHIFKNSYDLVLP
jgi:hypothetical protein